jgi:hypothetical protein
MARYWRIAVSAGTIGRPADTVQRLRCPSESFGLSSLPFDTIRVFHCILLSLSLTSHLVRSYQVSSAVVESHKYALLLVDLALPSAAVQQHRAQQVALPSNNNDAAHLPYKSSFPSPSALPLGHQHSTPSLLISAAFVPADRTTPIQQHRRARLCASRRTRSLFLPADPSPPAVSGATSCSSCSATSIRPLVPGQPPQGIPGSTPARTTATSYNISDHGPIGPSRHCLDDLFRLLTDHSSLPRSKVGVGASDATCQCRS